MMRNMEPGAATDERAVAFDLLRRFGTSPEAFLIRYDAPWRYHFGRRVEGVVAYVVSNGTAVAWSDPLCGPDDTSVLLKEFIDEMRAQGLRMCLVALSEPVARVALANGAAVLKIGEEPVFDLTTWRQPRGDPGKKLRWGLNRARRANVVVQAYRPGQTRDPDLEAELLLVQARWEVSLGRPIVRSFLRPAPLQEVQEKRIFVARVTSGDGTPGPIEAFVASSPIYGRDGWYLEDLVRLPSAPNGATELLLVEAIHALAAEGARCATLGIAPLRRSDEQLDRRARWLVPVLRLAFDQFDARYHFASLSRYKAKFAPSAWEPRYVAFDPPRPSVGLVRGVVAVLDPPAASNDTATPRSWRLGRALIAAQAAVWMAASLLTLAPGHLLKGLAALLAPVGAAGIGVALLLLLARTRIGRRQGGLDRALAVFVEGLLVVAAATRLEDSRGGLVALGSIVLAATTLVLVLRSSATPAPSLREGVAPH
jgi:lysylphosphatidylglycerol synthetase-like protein (DUF2156 family)